MEHYKYPHGLEPSPGIDITRAAIRRLEKEVTELQEHNGRLEVRIQMLEEYVQKVTATE
jgi:hypothetical protein